MQVAFETLTTDWIALSDIIDVEEDVKYFIQNRGPQPFLALESSSVPDSLAGNIVYSGDALVYSKGIQTLYIKAYNETTEINISKEG